MLQKGIEKPFAVGEMPCGAHMRGTQNLPDKLRPVSAFAVFSDYAYRERLKAFDFFL